MNILDTLIAMKEFILAPILEPQLFNQWLATPVGKKHASAVKGFSEEFVALLDSLDQQDKEAVGDEIDLTKFKSRKDKWVDCLLGEEVGYGKHAHGFQHDEITTVHHFIAKRENAPICKYLEETLRALSSAAKSCEEYICKEIDFSVPLAKSAEEIEKAKEILIVYRAHREEMKRKDALKTAVEAVIPDATVHRSETLKLLQAPEALTTLQRSPSFSLQLQKQLQAKMVSRDSKRDVFPISCTQRMGKILPLQEFKKILPHLSKLFEIYQFLATCKYVEHSKTLNTFYIYMLNHLRPKQHDHYLQLLFTMLSDSLDKLIADAKLHSEKEITAYFAENPRIKIYWQGIYACFIEQNTIFSATRFNQLADRISQLLYPPKILTRSDSATVEHEDTTVEATPSPPLEEDTFHIHDSDNDMDLLNKLLDSHVRPKVSNRTSSDVAVLKREGVFREKSTTLKRLDTAPPASMLDLTHSGTKHDLTVAKRQKH